jgi:RecA/RadA recombinase
LDRQLGGGLALGMLSEVTGGSGSGKSDLALLTTCMTTLPRAFGGLDSCVMYVSIGRSFPMRRLLELAQARFAPLLMHQQMSSSSLTGVDALLQHIMSRVLPFEWTSCSLPEAQRRLEQDLCAEGGRSNPLLQDRVRLLVLDSLQPLTMANGQPQQVGSYHSQVQSLATTLNSMAHSFRLAVLAINGVVNLQPQQQQQQQQNGAGVVIPQLSDVLVPAFGDAWNQSIHVRLALERFSSGSDNADRRLTIVRSPLSAVVSMPFRISGSGIALVDDMAPDFHSANYWPPNRSLRVDERAPLEKQGQQQHLLTIQVQRGRRW